MSARHLHVIGPRDASEVEVTASTALATLALSGGLGGGRPRPFLTVRLAETPPPIDGDLQADHHAYVVDVEDPEGRGDAAMHVFEVLREKTPWGLLLTTNDGSTLSARPSVP